MNLLDILKNINPKPVVGFDHDYHIFYGDIIQTCKVLGQDNTDLIDAFLKKLEEENQIKIVYLNTPGFEDLPVGVLLK